MHEKIPPLCVPRHMEINFRTLELSFVAAAAAAARCNFLIMILIKSEFLPRFHAALLN
jgi:hypothetical protein